MNFRSIREIFKRVSLSDVKTPLGRWNINNYRETSLKIKYATEDNCGIFRHNYKNEMKREGDKIQYNYDGLVSWGGLFSQLEYKKNKWTAFATLTGSYTGYQRKDYFDKKDVDLGPEKKGLNKFFDFFKDNRNDNVLPAIIGFNDVLLHNGTDYLVQTQSLSTAIRKFTNQSLNIPYVDGDIVRMIFVNSTWGTNPTQIAASGFLKLQ
jgi:hypothetical protein